jgi:hypothetical protein
MLFYLVPVLGRNLVDLLVSGFVLVSSVLAQVFYWFDLDFPVAVHFVLSFFLVNSQTVLGSGRNE